MASGPSINYSRFAKQGDIFLGAGVVVILLVMLVPLPTFLLDVMLSLNISLSILILLTAMFMTSPLEFSIFPSLLLVTTLMRLALNVASTRLILLNGDQGANAAGNVIRSFAEFVVGGSYVVGAVIFLILFILNKVVITAGTTRIAEVAARFTLDAMPGKQMAIEADLNSGLIDEEEATRRRENIRKEADFYGAMDGAGKFVQGDVTAGLFITLINLIGGILIAVVQKGMSWDSALMTFSLLSIGDGLVSTIPSIIISIAAGLIVSRAAAEAKMGEEYIAQLTYNSRVLKLTSAVLFIFALVPGLPTIPFLFFSASLFIVSRIVGKNSDTTAQDKKKAKGGSAASEPANTPEEMQDLLPLDTLELEVGYGLIPLVDEEQNGNLLSRIRSIRRQFALDMGVIIPSLHLRDNLQLKPGQYVLLIKGNQVATAEILIDHYLAMDPGNALHQIEGIETREPAFNLPAIWISEMQREETMLAGYTVVDPSTVIATHLTEVLKRHLADFLGRQEVQGLLDTLAKHSPKAVEELVPGILPLGSVQKVLQNLVRENVSIRDMLTIVEALGDYGGSVKNPDTLTEYVRERLGRSITKAYLDSDGVLPVITLGSKTEQTLQEAIRQVEGGSYLALNPSIAQQLIHNINMAIEGAVGTDGQPVLLATPIVRPHLAQLITRFLPNVPVISQGEIPPDTRLQAVGNVEID
ncbi:flagellar biosynthesis protein FlhA [Lawsonia intracellularis]|uniref:Flagellar biosynthesis protein FlhA n=1 Tax=Lawsonia intracellularis (strain PHE/MN1-00) TaxID=363253 RepID=Q1MQZ3_LAWIP|nr:flagellar biosynthesis protein FlhA [Lawsonia intracellularis]AGC49945.1 flagellar biosynthesis protein FlhA [Lawsonia intracellularis N343]KAA0205441.1 flagellar biosynthesis protein FlhA [Lawsonia intracellularis]MBZ3892016.1 flagellar biosynthesis protein FlhA [Lawsonia intracellularis]OMQ04704.1 flagellar biosynthesis protein FlhA [Lawsonia intracellularis]RBN32010.1 flagellar biosynthesis protein FlhA [Lawsonia intracellularis]